MFWCGFQNAKYSVITDISSIALFSKKDLKLFITDLEAALKSMQQGEKVNLEWSKKSYKLNLYDFSNSLFLTDVGNEGYTALPALHVKALIVLASKVDFGKTQLLETPIEDLTKK